MSDEPRVWIGCLGCYNAGTLAGKWFDAVDCPEEMEEFNKALGIHPGAESWELGPDAFSTVKTPELPRGVSPEHVDPVYGPHEELWVMDHDGFRGLLAGECSPGTAKELAEALTEVGNNDAFDAWLTTTSLSEHDDVAGLLEAFGNASYSVGDSQDDAAYEYLDETGAFEGLPTQWEHYEWDLAQAWFHNLENGGELHTVRHNGMTYLFFTN